MIVACLSRKHHRSWKEGRMLTVAVFGKGDALETEAGEGVDGLAGYGFGAGGFILLVCATG